MPTGKVDFTWGGVYTIGTATLNASGVATLTKSNLNADSYPLTATYVGDPNNAGSTSATLAQVVTQTTSAATLTSSPNPATEGQPVTFLVDITSPTITATGPVTFTVGNTVLGTARTRGRQSQVHDLYAGGRSKPRHRQLFRRLKHFRQFGFGNGDCAAISKSQVDSPSSFAEEGEP